MFHQIMCKLNNVSILYSACEAKIKLLSFFIFFFLYPPTINGLDYSWMGENRRKCIMCIVYLFIEYLDLTVLIVGMGGGWMDGLIRFGMWMMGRVQCG